MAYSEQILLANPVLLETARAALSLRKDNSKFCLCIFAPAGEEGTLRELLLDVLRESNALPDAIRTVPLSGVSPVLPELALPASMRSRAESSLSSLPDKGGCSESIAVVFHSKRESVSALTAALERFAADIRSSGVKIFNWGVLRRGKRQVCADKNLAELALGLGLGAGLGEERGADFPGSAIFFRNGSQLNFLRREFLDWMREPKPRRVKVFGCSTGAEAYTLAIILADMHLLDRVKIVASDINSERVNLGASGALTRRDYLRFPEEFQKRYTVEWEDDELFIHPSILTAVDFEIEDIFEADSAGDGDEYDLVLLQNTTVHFSEEQEKAAIAIASRLVAPGGLLLLGGSRLGSWRDVLMPEAFEPERMEAREIHDGWTIQRRKYDENPDAAPVWALPPFAEEAGWEWRYVTTFRRIDPAATRRINRNEPIIVLNDVGVHYRVPRRFGRKQGRRADPRWEASRFWALRHLDLVVYKGEVLGIIGRNGSGKSTIGRLLAGAFDADEGKVSIKGKVTLLALGLGFKSELSGYDNIMINGALLGMSRRQVKEKIDAIVEFAGLGEFINEPVKNYSSGMRARLGFSVAVSFRPEILILDEVLATGDIEFKEKARGKVKELIRDASVVIIISHQIAFVKAICTKVVWLHEGKIVRQGDPAEVTRLYQAGMPDTIEED